jgi:hypothetical protein
MVDYQHRVERSVRDGSVLTLATFLQGMFHDARQVRMYLAAIGASHPHIRFWPGSAARWKGTIGAIRVHQEWTADTGQPIFDALHPERRTVTTHVSEAMHRAGFPVSPQTLRLRWNEMRRTDLPRLKAYYTSLRHVLLCAPWMEDAGYASVAGLRRRPEPETPGNGA